MPLRKYQRNAIDLLYQWFELNPKGNPCIVLPTGSGKSWIIAELCKEALSNWPKTKILILSHVKEILSQDIDKIFQTWPNAPVGIYSAGLKQKEINSITFAGIQSVRNKSKEIGFVDLIIVDEAHLINHKSQGGYRKLINELTEINPEVRVIGLTATPYRLGHGMITDKPGLFDGLIEPVSIEELVEFGFLSPLRSKSTEKKIDVSKVHKRGGEYIESELQKAVNTEDNNVNAIKEVLKRADNRKSWLFFCTGIAHAETINAILINYGIKSACVTGKTPIKERNKILDDFKTGKIQAVTNANVLTTGFDNPNLDLIVMLRPTLSPGLYIQMAGRGMRIAEGKKDCLVLDFAGVIATHGPITAVLPPRKSKKGDKAPTKECPQCQEILHASIMLCPVCKYEFPQKEKISDWKLRNDDIMGKGILEKEITGWRWRKHISRNSGKEMLSVTYYSGLSKDIITEYLPVTHGGYAGHKAMQLLQDMAKESQIDIDTNWTLEEAAKYLNDGNHPDRIYYHKDGKYYRVISRLWEQSQ